MKNQWERDKERERERERERDTEKKEREIALYSWNKWMSLIVTHHLNYNFPRKNDCVDINILCKNNEGLNLHLCD